MNFIRANKGVCLILASLFVLIFIGKIYSTNVDKKGKWSRTFIAFGDVSKSILGFLTPMVIFLMTFSLVDSVQNRVHIDNNNLSKTNEPLILKNEPTILFKGDKGKINFKVKQGTITKSELILFNNNGVARYITLHFTKKGKSLSLWSNYFDFTKLANIDPNRLIKASDVNQGMYNINNGSVLASKQLVRFSVVSKDSKGNVTADYYIVRPKVKSSADITLKSNYNNKEYSYTHRYKNTSEYFCISCPIIGSHSLKTDTSNIMYGLTEHEGEFKNYKYDLIKKKDRKIDASKFKASDGSVLQDTFEKDHPNKGEGVDADVYAYLNFEVPTESQIRQDILEIDNIIKDFQRP